MLEVDRDLWKSGRDSLQSRVILSREALQVARQIFPGDEIISSLPVPKDHDYKSIGTYPRLAAYIRRYPLESQQQFFSGIWGPQGIDIPNWRGFANFLAKCNSIPWFAPQQETDESLLQTFVNQHLVAAKWPELPVLMIRNNWEEATDVVIQRLLEREPWVELANTIDKVAKSAGFQKVMEALHSPVWESAWFNGSRHPILTKADNKEMVDVLTVQVFIDEHINLHGKEKEWFGVYGGVLTGANQILNGAKYYVVADLLQEYGYAQNPFEHLVEIYRLGYQPLGVLEEIHDGDRMRVFGVFQPPLVA